LVNFFPRFIFLKFTHVVGSNNARTPAYERKLRIFWP